MRVAVEGRSNYSIPASAFATTTVTIPHNLGYVPYFRIWIKYPSGRTYYGNVGATSYEDSSFTQTEDIHADTTNLYVRMADGAGAGVGGSGTIYYRIYAEQAI